MRTSSSESMGNGISPISIMSILFKIFLKLFRMQESINIISSLKEKHISISKGIRIINTYKKTYQNKGELWCFLLMGLI